MPQAAVLLLILNKQLARFITILFHQFFISSSGNSGQSYILCHIGFFFQRLVNKLVLFTSSCVVPISFYDLPSFH